MHTGQFAKVASCIDLAKAHEKHHGWRYDLLVRTRPDVLWQVKSVKSRTQLSSP